MFDAAHGAATRAAAAATAGAAEELAAAEAAKKAATQVADAACVVVEKHKPLVRKLIADAQSELSALAIDYDAAREGASALRIEVRGGSTSQDRFMKPGK